MRIATHRSIRSLHPGRLALVGFLVLLGLVSCQPARHSTHSSEPSTNAGPANGPHGDAATTDRRFRDAEYWAERFEKPSRDRWQRPEEVIAAMTVEPEFVIADIGSGTGYFPVRFARVATAGRVYGVDIEPTLVNYLNLRALREGLPHLVSLVCESDDPGLPEKCDRIFICNTYHHIDNRRTYFRNLKKSLKAAGRLVVVDFKKGDFPVGPPDDHKLAPARVIAELEDAGYRLVGEHELPYQYLLLFE